MLPWLSLENVLAGVLVAGLLCYTLTAGADFGAGLWVLLIRGPRREEQRTLVADTIAPIWEANHVWLIFVIVILFTAFPIAFSQIMISLAIPFAILLGAIVLRGAAFVFYRYDPHPNAEDRVWQATFACASFVGPFCLGLIVGALVSGRVGPEYGYIHSWLSPMPLAIGMLTVVLFVHLASVYLVREADRRGENAKGLVGDFRRRAIVSSAITGLAAILTTAIAYRFAPHVYVAALPLVVIGGLIAIFRATALLRGKVSAARLLVGVEVPLIFAGWVWAQFPFVIYGKLTVAQAAAPRSTLLTLLWVFGIGLLFIVPGFALLFRIFGAFGPNTPGSPSSSKPAALPAGASQT